MSSLRVLSLSKKNSFISTRKLNILNKRLYNHSLQRLGIDYGHSKIKVNPYTDWEWGKGGPYRYFSYGNSIFIWWFITGFTFFTFGPAYWGFPVLGQFLRAHNYWTHELHDQSFRDPLIPPDSTWLEPTTRFVKEMEARRKRYEENPKTIYY